jgi:hypothetical protein
MVAKAGKFGSLLACSRYPDCDNTREVDSPRWRWRASTALATILAISVVIAYLTTRLPGYNAFWWIYTQAATWVLAGLFGVLMWYLGRPTRPSGD